MKSLPCVTHRDTENKTRQQLITQYIAMRYYYNYFLMALRKSRSGLIPCFGSLP